MSEGSRSWRVVHTEAGQAGQATSVGLPALSGPEHSPDALGSRTNDTSLSTVTYAESVATEGAGASDVQTTEEHGSLNGTGGGSGGRGGYVAAGEARGDCAWAWLGLRGTTVDLRGELMSYSGSYDGAGFDPYDGHESDVFGADGLEELHWHGGLAPAAAAPTDAVSGSGPSTAPAGGPEVGLAPMLAGRQGGLGWRGGYRRSGVPPSLPATGGGSGSGVAAEAEPGDSSGHTPSSPAALPRGAPGPAGLASSSNRSSNSNSNSSTLILSILSSSSSTAATVSSSRVRGSDTTHIIGGEAVAVGASTRAALAGGAGGAVAPSPHAEAQGQSAAGPRLAAASPRGAGTAQPRPATGQRAPHPSDPAPDGRQQQPVPGSCPQVAAAAAPAPAPVLARSAASRDRPGAAAAAEAVVPAASGAVVGGRKATAAQPSPPSPSPSSSSSPGAAPSSSGLCTGPSSSRHDVTGVASRLPSRRAHSGRGAARPLYGSHLRQALRDAEDVRQLQRLVEQSGSEFGPEHVATALRRLADVSTAAAAAGAAAAGVAAGVVAAEAPSGGGGANSASPTKLDEGPAASAGRRTQPGASPAPEGSEEAVEQEGAHPGVPSATISGAGAPAVAALASRLVEMGAVMLQSRPPQPNSQHPTPTATPASASASGSTSGPTPAANNGVPAAFLSLALDLILQPLRLGLPPHAPAVSAALSTLTQGVGSLRLGPLLQVLEALAQPSMRRWAPSGGTLGRVFLVRAQRRLTALLRMGGGGWREASGGGSGSSEVAGARDEGAEAVARGGSRAEAGGQGQRGQLASGGGDGGVSGSVSVGLAARAVAAVSALAPGGGGRLVDARAKGAGGAAASAPAAAPVSASSGAPAAAAAAEAGAGRRLDEDFAAAVMAHVRRALGPGGRGVAAADAVRMSYGIARFRAWPGAAELRGLAMDGLDPPATGPAPSGPRGPVAASVTAATAGVTAGTSGAWQPPPSMPPQAPPLEPAFPALPPSPATPPGLHRPSRRPPAPPHEPLAAEAGTPFVPEGSAMTRDGPRAWGARPASGSPRSPAFVSGVPARVPRQPLSPEAALLFQLVERIPYPTPTPATHPAHAPAPTDSPNGGDNGSASPPPEPAQSVVPEDVRLSCTALQSLYLLGVRPRAGWIRAVLAASHPHLPYMDMDLLSRTWWALAGSGWRVGPLWRDGAFRSMLRRGDRLSPDQVCMLLGGCARWRLRPRSVFMRALLGSVAAALPAFQATSCVALADALAGMRYHPLPSFLRPYLARCSSQLPYMDGRALLKLLWALCRMGLPRAGGEAWRAAVLDSALQRMPLPPATAPAATDPAKRQHSATSPPAAGGKLPAAAAAVPVPSAAAKPTAAAPPALAPLTPAQTGLLARCVGVAELRPSDAWIRTFWSYSAVQLPYMRPGALVLLLRGVARLKAAPPLWWARSYLAATEAALPTLSAPCLVRLAGALRRCPVRPPAPWLTAFRSRQELLSAQLSRADQTECAAMLREVSWRRRGTVPPGWRVPQEDVGNSSARKRWASRDATRRKARPKATEIRAGSVVALGLERARRASGMGPVGGARPGQVGGGVEGTEEGGERAAGPKQGRRVGGTVATRPPKGDR
ncbi:hypothetical protein HYH03_009507 [Edaphochlamys debaryana]|uniref:Uncharacterized protein n=1 Tax=Edaphochlamys debaryana TaxID=47281 RepID=A0A836BXT2_9CHLO|nr:hypothetical protein HYH03_009507 [Edaphochlamys debaryana]|eukprot:KAG2492267.1 hypothetical protein HYH03_009507 [Edaphochlamys debaryana]